MDRIHDIAYKYEKRQGVKNKTKGKAVTAIYTNKQTRMKLSQKKNSSSKKKN
jgi:hypothetical protein